MLFLKSAEDVSTVRFFLEGEVLERLLMLDYPMVDFVALKRAALTTPFFKDHLFTIFQLFVYIS